MACIIMCWIIFFLMLKCLLHLSHTMGQIISHSLESPYTGFLATVAPVSVVVDDFNERCVRAANAEDRLTKSNVHLSFEV